MTADWSSLPPELVCLVSHRLSTIEDFSAFPAVCRSYRSAVSKKDHGVEKVSQQQQPPWLLLSCLDIGDDPPTDERGLLSLCRNNKRFHMNLPELYGRHCWGTSHGWIVTLARNLEFHIFNPLNRHRIAIPKIIPGPAYDVLGSNFRDENDRANWLRYIFIRRVLLVKRNKNEPSTRRSKCLNRSKALLDEFFVVATTSPFGYLRVLRPVNNNWVIMNMSSDISTNSDISTTNSTFDIPTGFIFDVVNYKGVIYALCNFGKMLICSNLEGPGPPTAVEFMPIQPQLLEGDEKLYLVESEGDLLLVARVIDFDSSENPKYVTTGFDYYRLDVEDKQWIEIEELGDRALFVGDGQSLSLSAPELFNCRKNCIYFADDNHEYFKGGVGGVGGHDFGIFDEGSYCVWPLYKGPDMFSSYSPPTWFTPSFV